MRLLLSLTLITTLTCVAQESTNASGGDATGSGGTVAYSIGQVAYLNQAGTNGNENQGVQQPYEIYTVALDEIETINLTIYPNPTVDELVIELNETSGDNLLYQLIDLDGKVLKSKSSNNQTVKFDMSSLAKGSYILNVLNQKQLVKSFKIIKN